MFEARRVVVLVGTSLVLMWSGASAASPGQRCEATKNQEAGKYAACLAKAAAKLIKASGSCSLATATTCQTDGDCPPGETCNKSLTRYTSAVDKCALKFTYKWNSLTQKAEDAGDPCPDGLASSEIRDAIDEHVANIAAGLAGEGLNTCGEDLATCEEDLAATQAGSATPAHVLSGQTFTSTSGVGVAGTMPNNGAVSLTPGTTAQAIPAGYHNGSGIVAGDVDLLSTNIVAGVNLFGVSGTAMQASGAATAGQVLSGVTFSNAVGADIGTMPNIGAVSLTPGTSTQTIAAGYHNGSGTVAGDPDLVASNIVAGVNLFGVSGTATSGASVQLLKTGQTLCWNTAGTLINCDGSGQDGELQLGLAASHSDNGDGTITDNRTGLVWERLNDAGGINDKDATFTWANAFNKVRLLNGDAGGCIAAGNPSSCCSGAGMGSGCAAFAGFTDWRLPSVNELQSLSNYGTLMPAVHAAFNASCTPSCVMCSCTQPSLYWSNTSLLSNPINAWGLGFDDGYVSDSIKLNSLPVRAVRGGS